MTLIELRGKGYQVLVDNIAAVISLKELDLESNSLSENPEFMKIIEKARQEFATGKRVSLAEMKREMLG